MLSVGRDGITLGTRCRGGSVFEVAATATVSVLDRRGRRLGTVYLGHTPEFGQKVPLGRPAEPDEIAPCFVFLAADESSYFVGQVLHPNGGEIINT